LTLGCDPSLREGEIRGKGFRPEHTDMILMPMTVSTGKDVTTTLTPMFFYYPDSYSIDIRKFDGKRWQEATWWVDRATYDQAVVGGYYRVKANDLDERPRQETQPPNDRKGSHATKP
jgi:hypothetical protein